MEIQIQWPSERERGIGAGELIRFHDDEVLTTEGTEFHRGKFTEN